MIKFVKMAIPAVILSCTAGGAVYAQANLVKVDGSSTVYPVTEAVAEEFQKSKKNAIKVTVGVSGTGGGFKKFCRGDTDISNASRPIRVFIVVVFADRRSSQSATRPYRVRIITLTI